MNRRKSSGGGKWRSPYLALLLVIGLVALVIFLLERTRKVPQPQSGGEQKVVSPQKLPPRPAPPEVAAPAPPERKETKAPEPQRVAGPGTLAIIVDDMGSSMREVQSLLAIDLPITFAVIPGLARAKGVAQEAHGAGEEVIVHMPMEPQGYPQQPLEKIGLLVSMEEGEIEQRVRGFFEAVPHAVGANNHMGSRYTERREKMEPVLKVLKEKGVFFVDSKTSHASVGIETARAAGVRCAARQVFLDNVQEVAAIKRQLAQAAAIVRKRGNAIAIGHPHPATIRALQEMMPELARDGIRFVHASALVS